MIKSGLPAIPVDEIKVEPQEYKKYLKMPTTKECTYCFSTIPIKATRCPHCTSELKAG